MTMTFKTFMIVVTTLLLLGNIFFLLSLGYDLTIAIIGFSISIAAACYVLVIVLTES